MASIFGFLKNLNTHATGTAGIGSVLGALALHTVATTVLRHPTNSEILNVGLSVFDMYFSGPILAVGGVASYLGMPKTIAASPPAPSYPPPAA